MINLTLKRKDFKSTIEFEKILFKLDLMVSDIQYINEVHLSVDVIASSQINVEISDKIIIETAKAMYPNRKEYIKYLLANKTIKEIEGEWKNIFNQIKIGLETAFEIHMR